MNHSTDDPDDIVQRKIDLNQITKMSYQMLVPDSITVGPNRSTLSRLHQDIDQVPVRMEVPDSIRLGSHGSNGMLNGADVAVSDDLNQSLDSTTTTPHASEDDYTTIDAFANNQEHQPIKIADSWHIEPFTEIDDKYVINNLQSLQNRIHHIERTLARRDFRDRMFYTCIIGYFLLQALLSVRRSMLN